MSHISESKTIFEKAWDNPKSPFLYRSEELGVGAIVDALPKLTDQIVIIPRDGFPGHDNAALSDLPTGTRIAMEAVANAFARKMSTFSGVPGVRAIQHTEGFGVPDHPHIVMYPALRGESKAFFEPSRFTDESVRRHLIDRALINLALNTSEKTVLDEELEKLWRSLA